MNVIKIKNDPKYLYYKYEGFWRKDPNPNHKDNLRDFNNNPFPFPKENDKPWDGQEQFLKKLLVINKLTILVIYDLKKKDYENCRLCGEFNVYTKGFMLKNMNWNNTLPHYITVHNLKPTTEFINFVTNYVLPTNIQYDYLPKKIYTFNRFQIDTLDMLLNWDNKHVITGLIEFTKHGPDSISIDLVKDRDTLIRDEEISSIRQYNLADYEYMFYVHPAKQKLLDFPSVLELSTFLVNYNDYVIQGMLVNTMEGMYHFMVSTDKPYISITQKSYHKINEILENTRAKLTKKYGKFDQETFHSKIAKEISHIESLQKIFKKHDIKFEYLPRIKKDKKWINQLVKTTAKVKVPVFTI